MATTYTNSTVPVIGTNDDDGFNVGSSGETLAFFGATPVARVSLTQQATTATTTQLRAELTGLQNALHNLGLITIT